MQERERSSRRRVVGLIAALALCCGALDAGVLEGLPGFLRRGRDDRGKPSAAEASPVVEKLCDSRVDPSALTIDGSFGRRINGLSFQQDAVVTHGTHQYVGYYDAKRRVCLARRELPRGAWEVVRFGDYDFQSQDAHNVISLGICPKDGTIHLAFDHHGHPLHYRVSRKGVATEPRASAWGADLFSPVMSYLEPGKPIRITYPRFWQTPDGGLQFCYRRGGSGNGDRMLVDYDPETGAWRDTRQIDSGEGRFEDAYGASTSRCSYPNGYDYGPRGRLHATWVWRESSQGPNHDLMYAYSEDGGRTWRNHRGDALTQPARVDSPGLRVVEIGRGHGLMNTHGQAVDSRGRIHAVMWHCTDETLRAAGSRPGEERWGPPEARRYHHYWRDDTGEWRHTELPWVAGTRPKLFLDREDDAVLTFSTRQPSSALIRDAIVSAGDLVIAVASARASWTDWRIAHVETGPFVNEMVGDPYRWRRDGVLSILVQETPEEAHEPTALRILDFVRRD